mmetsp:Transcript_2861/g.4314  ORF Transcript_2861/g.4314 Transcript_2861/m.4314 type:complete len:393 (+) Transcript_2861:151-1329(+)
MSTHVLIDASDEDSSSSGRMAVVRYFLDRPGYGIDNSSARLWKDPPKSVTASDIKSFLEKQGIVDVADCGTTLLEEVYLDRFKCYMLLDACEKDKIRFDFSATTKQEPGILNVRLTDISTGQVESGSPSGSSTVTSRICNTSPIGLFAFSMTVGMEMMDLTGKLCPGSFDPSWVLTWGPYAFYVSGLLQFVVGLWEVTRNNIYGATAFMSFGSFWMANATKLILTTYFPADIDPVLLDSSDNLGYCFRNLYILAFVMALFKQTLTMTKMTSTLIALLTVQLLATAISPYAVAVEWIAMIFGWIVSIFSFYVFTAEFTNEVYNREVFKLYPWKKEDEGDTLEVYGAAGRGKTLKAKVTHLRAGGFESFPPNSLAASKEKSKKVLDLRAVQPIP